MSYTISMGPSNRQTENSNFAEGLKQPSNPAGLFKPSNQVVKQLYKKIKDQGFKFYCVGCGKERRQSLPARIGSPQFFGQVLITTAFFTMLTYPWLHWKGAFAWLIPIGLVFEALFRMKVRGAMVCPDCKFDPVLYLSNRPKALQQVEDAWKAKYAEKNLPYPERKKKSNAASKDEKKANPSDRLTSI